MTFFRDNQKTIAYWFIGIACIITGEILIGEFLNISIIWKINFVWMQWLVVIPSLIGAAIELDRIKKESGENLRSISTRPI